MLYNATNDLKKKMQMQDSKTLQQVNVLYCKNLPKRQYNLKQFHVF